MKIVLTNLWRQLTSKVINIIYLIISLAIVVGGLVYFNTFKLPYDIISIAISQENYLGYLILCFILNLLVYRSTSFTMKIKKEERYSLKLHYLQITLLLLFITLGIEYIVISLLLLKMYTFLSFTNLIYLFVIMLFTNLLTYAFAKNLLGKLLTLIALVIIKFTYTTKYGIYYYFATTFITFAITVATEELFYLNFNKKVSLVWLVRNKFIESIVYVLRYTKSLSAYIIFLILSIYLVLPSSYRIHYKIYLFDIDTYLAMLFGIALFYIAIAGLMFKRENNTYITTYNPYIYVYHHIFNSIFFIITTILASIQEIYLKNANLDLMSLFANASTKLLQIGIFLVVSSIWRKRSILSILSALIGSGIYTGLLSKQLTNPWFAICSLLVFFAIAILIEFTIAKNNIKNNTLLTKKN